MYYKYEEIHSRPTVTPDSEIPENLLHLSHSFGYDSGRRGNLKLLDDRTLIFIAGNMLVLLDILTKEQRYLRSCSGGGIGAITAHPSREYFAVAEKGNHPNIIIYEYPSLRPYRILRGGTEREYSFVDFNLDGSLLASVGNAPDYMLTLWDWRQEEVTLSCKAISQEVYRVSFSPYNPGLLTSSGCAHIKFWKMAATFTGPKLEGVTGRFGKTEATDIDGFVELPDGKVVSGTDWGNLLLWDGDTIMVEICRKEGQTCHVGTVQPFTLGLEDEQLMTIGSDGVVRGWDSERINTAHTNGDSSKFEIEPINEMVVGHNVCLTSVVRSSLSDSFVWFAQDFRGAIWKLDLSFTNTSPDPECLFSFHAGAIQGLDISKKSHLMATTTLDRSVKVFDFLSKRELTTSHFNQGGTTLCWAPLSVNQIGGLLVTGFEDGVVRLLELYDPRKLHLVTGCSSEQDAKLHLRQAFKPHNAAVTAVAFDRNGETLATGSADNTVFFFSVGEKYNPIGFVNVPGPVQMLEWSPHSQNENRLLILCQTGHVIEVQSPDPEDHKSTKTFQLYEQPRQYFRFRSIKSQIKRKEEIARRQSLKKKKKEQSKESKQTDEGQEDPEDEEDLPPIYIPDPPSPLYCGFYSQPGHFWLSMGGFDSGFLYHCKFSEEQDEDPDQRKDEPFDFLPVLNADDDPICSVTFSSNRQLLLCGMNSGSIRVYPLQPGDHGLTSMKAYWALSVHDNHYGHLRHICCSHDDLFVLTAGDDGNIFSFSLLPPEELKKSLQRKKADVPSPRMSFDSEMLALDIEDPAAYSIETAKQKVESDRLRREAELKDVERRKKLIELQKKFKQVLNDNQSLPEHVRLKPEELQLDHRLDDQAENLKSQRMMDVTKQLAWEQEHCTIALRKLQDWIRDSVGVNIVTVVAIQTNHRVSTYRVSAHTDSSAWVRHQSTSSPPDGDKDAPQDCRKSRAEPAKSSSETTDEEVLHPVVVRTARIKLGDRQEERLRKAAEKAEQARAKIKKRKEEWAQIYAEKPKEDYEDPDDVKAIREVRENIEDFIGVRPIRVNTEAKREELIALEEMICEKQNEMNYRVVSLRDSKVRLVTKLHSQAQQLQKVQQRLAVHLHRAPPPLPVLLPEETPEKKFQCSRATLERYKILRKQRFQNMEQAQQEGAVSLVELLEKEMAAGEEKKEGGGKETEEEDTFGLSLSSVTREEDEAAEDGGVELSELEEELQREEEIRLLHEQNTLLEEMESSVCRFDSDLLLLHRQKLHLDWQLKLADLHLLKLVRELLLLKKFEKREGSLHEKLNTCIKEENSITPKLAECNDQLEQKKSVITKLQDRENALTAVFQASLGEDNKFEEFLTKVFKKKIKRVKKKEQTRNEEENDEDSDEDDWDDDYDSDVEEAGSALNYSVCPADCEQELFDTILQLRERRLDLEELLTKETKITEALKKERDALVKKEKMVKSNRKEVEDDLELINMEKLQKINDLDMVVPLRLHQIEFVSNGSLPLDLSEALVVEKNELKRLQERIQQLQVEKLHEKNVYQQVRQQRARLIHELRDMATEIQTLERQCNELMMSKFGKLVNLEALQMMSGSRRLEELKQEKLFKEAEYAKEVKEWDAKVEEARLVLMEVTSYNTEYLRSATTFLDQQKEFQLKLNARHKKMDRQQFQDYRRHEVQEEIRRLKQLVKTQSQQAEALRGEITLLSSKWGHVLPPNPARLPPLAPPPTPP
ncbi:cilia- and flagella-associated protein 44 [Pholidichthys leucotaenia]